MLPIKLHFSSEYMPQSKKIFKEENKMARKENLVKALFILACLSILDLTRKFSVGGSMSSSMTGFNEYMLHTSYYRGNDLYNGSNYGQQRLPGI